MRRVKKEMYKQNRNIKELENLHRIKKKILELKSTVTEMKDSLEGVKGRFQQTGGISGLEDRTVEIIQSEKQKGKGLKKSKQSLSDLWTPLSRPTYPL